MSPPQLPRLLALALLPACYSPTTQAERVEVADKRAECERVCSPLAWSFLAWSYYGTACACHGPAVSP